MAAKQITGGHDPPRFREGMTVPAAEIAIQRQRSLVLALVLVAVAAVLFPGSPAHAASIVERPVVSNADFPAAFTLARDGKIFYGERFTGEIRVFDPSTSSDSLFFDVTALATGGESGLLGLALHPNYPSTRYVYAFATRKVNGATRNQILRITDSGDRGAGMKVLFAEPAASYHNGGRILFGPDGKLYAVIGDRGDPASAQTLSRRTGKILRMTAWGSVPADNPFSGNYTYAYGIRNSFGFDFDPETGRLWETENGPQCNDELNLILRGRNHGWGPSWTCSSPPAPPTNTNRDGPSPVLPRAWYTPPTAPTGTAFCAVCGLGPESEGRLFYGAWNDGQIRRVTLGPRRQAIVSESVVHSHGSGILSMEAGRDGALYFSDSGGIYRLALSG